jgi:predicted phosphodiesterase
MGFGIDPNLTGWCEPASGETTNGIIADMQRKDYDLVLHIGDISYAVGYAVRWEQFFEQIQPIATQIPYMVAIGNHEFDYVGQPFNPVWANYSDDSRGECGVPFDSRFVMPANGQGDLWYSIDYPLLHVVVISTEHDFTTGSEQLQWIEQDLASVNRSEKWIILTGHRPMYTSNYFGQDWSIGAKMRQYLEPLMMKYGVDVAFWGHVHNYERMCPVYNKTCYGNLNHPRAPVHFIIGMAGQIFDDWWVSPQPEWSMFRASDYGYTRIHIPDTSSFHIEYVGDKDGSVHDDVWIYRNPNKLTHWE